MSCAWAYAVRMIFSRRPQHFIDDPLLTRPRVAEFIERDPARVTRYDQAGLMPPPDEVLEGDIPAWRRSTIRSWWLRRGGQLQTVSGRYHRQWDDLSLEPELLEERMVKVEFSTSRSAEVHVRAYRAMDGGGPVVILGWPRENELSRNYLGRDVIKQLRSALVVDVEVQHPVWLAVRAQYRYGEDANDARLPSEVTITDLENTRVTITPEDVARLIGRLFDVYPDDLYTSETIALRRHSPDQDTATPTAILDDAADLGPKVRRLRNIDQRIQAKGSDVLAFAAGLLADDVRGTDETVTTSAKSRAYQAQHGQDDEFTPRLTSGLCLAVFPQQRVLSPQERRLVHQYLLDQPLITSKTEIPIEDYVLEGGLYKIELRRDALPMLDGIRKLLLDPTLGDTAPLRDALAAAEKILAAEVHYADKEFARRDRQPRAETWSADTPIMTAYLHQLTNVAVDSLPFELRRRAQALLTYEYAADWKDRTLLWDEHSQLLALRGLDPSNLDVEAARSVVQMNHRPQDFNSPAPDMSEAVEQALIQAYMADRPRVLLEWPQAARSDGMTVLADARLVAPAANSGVERPVFIHHSNGMLEPLTRNGDDHFHGFVWGVSGTDTISDAVHALVTDLPVRDWRRYADEADDVAFQAHEWLRRYLLCGGANALDLEGDPIVERYRCLIKAVPAA